MRTKELQEMRDTATWVGSLGGGGGRGENSYKRGYSYLGGRPGWGVWMGENANTLLNEEEYLATHKVPNPATYLLDNFSL